MESAKASVLFVQFCYGGNGGIPMTIPSHVSWFARVHGEAQKDPRIGKIAVQILEDTPITMTRNRAVKIARDGGYDMVLMLDSDNQPDSELKSDPSAKPFWKTSFDFAYERLLRGVPSVVCAPYCGKPPHENVFCFFWEQHENSPHGSFSLEPYSRHVAATMTGIQPIAAGPTGVTLYTTNAFDLMDPPYFYYEYKDEPYQTEKASTEDVTNFRDINLQGHAKFGEPIVFCNWDAWAAHAKVKYVRKPQIAYADDVNERFKTAMQRNLDRADKTIDIDFEARMNKLLEENPEQVETVATPPEALGKFCETSSSTDKGGVAIVKRSVAGHVVKSVGHQTNGNALKALGDIVGIIAQERPNKAMRIIEVGSWVGESAVAMASQLKDGGAVFCVDTFEGDGSTDPINRAIAALGSDAIEDIFYQNTNGLPIRLLKGKSLVVAKKLDPQEADLVWVDAGHTYEDAKADIEAWWNHVADDGWIGGDDYSEYYPGVQQAVAEFFADRGVPVRLVDGTDFWVVSKKEALECLKTTN